MSKEKYNSLVKPQDRAKAEAEGLLGPATCSAAERDAAHQELARLIAQILKTVWKHPTITNPDGSINWGGVEDAIIATCREIEGGALRPPPNTTLTVKNEA
jgi:hypothetical protein